MDASGLRVSDEDREHAVGQLRTHAASGRLTVDELDERSARAFAAVTAGELAELFTDLPRPSAPPAPRPAPQPGRHVPRMPGKLSFAETWRAPARRERAMTELLEHVAPPLHRFGYQLTHRAPDRLVFSISRRPAWTILLAIFLFPLGLLALLYKEHENLTIDLIEDGGETIVSAQGVAPLPIRKAFATLQP